MARMLGRSKSLRLKTSQKDLHQQEANASAPFPTTTGDEARSDLHGLKAAGHATDPAKRVDTPEQVPRPRTASTPGDRGRHLQFHKKAAPVAITSAEATFSFPLPSPKTLFYAAEVHEEDMIGMALGSPTTPARWNHPARSTDYVTRPSLNRTVTHIAYDPSSHSSNCEEGATKTVSSMTDLDANHDVTKPKISRWKSLFGRKHTAPEPFYQLQQCSDSPYREDCRNDMASQRQSSSSRATNRAASPPSAPTSAHEIREARKKAKAAKKVVVDEAKYRIDSGKSLTSRCDNTTGEASPKPPPKDEWHSQVPKVTVSNGSQITSPRTPGCRTLLDVDIPNVELERYSVMFGSLLQPDRSSSLLVRRQADPGKLKPLTELSKKKDYVDSSNGLLKPTRRATSPSPAKSPTFALSLFPPPATARDTKASSPRVPSMHRPRPLQRSHTAPSISPSRQTFSKSGDSGGPRPAAPRMHTLPEAERITEPVAQILTPTPSSRHSFDSEETAAIATDPNPWKPRLAEPEWEILSKPSEGVSQVQREVQGQVQMQVQTQEASPRAQQLQNHSSPRLQTQQQQSKQEKSKSPGERTAFSPTATKLRDSPRNSPGERHSPSDCQHPGERKTPATTVGLARQVSVSRATGPKLLKPMVVSPAGSEKLVDRKPLTPTLVELRNSGRKSQRVILEDA